MWHTRLHVCAWGAYEHLGRRSKWIRLARWDERAPKPSSAAPVRSRSGTAESSASADLLRASSLKMDQSLFVNPREDNPTHPCHNWQGCHFFTRGLAIRRSHMSHMVTTGQNFQHDKMTAVSQGPSGRDAVRRLGQREISRLNATS